MIYIVLLVICLICSLISIIKDIKHDGFSSDVFAYPVIFTIVTGLVMCVVFIIGNAYITDYNQSEMTLVKTETYSLVDGLYPTSRSYGRTGVEYLITVEADPTGTAKWFDTKAEDTYLIPSNENKLEIKTYTYSERTLFWLGNIYSTRTYYYLYTDCVIATES